jgi:hypothetical protein
MRQWYSGTVRIRFLWAFAFRVALIKGQISGVWTLQQPQVRQRRHLPLPGTRSIM